MTDTDGTDPARDDAYYHRDERGQFEPVPSWRPDLPVLNVDWHCATAYAAWKAEREGTPWRLPWDLEWEKAARGVDGRIFPWGDGTVMYSVLIRPSSFFTCWAHA